MKKKLKGGGVLLLMAALALLAGCGDKKQNKVYDNLEDLSTGFQAAAAQDQLTQISTQGELVLYANLSNGEIAVEDQESGRTWYSNPVDKMEDGLASGYNKNTLLSAISVTYTTDQSVEMTCASYMSSVNKDGLSYRMEEDGSIIFLYDFPNEGFSIPVKYSISEQAFSAEILTANITEYDVNIISYIELLPFFGAGGTQASGYMLVPDGCGALIHYNSGNTIANTYSKLLYGFDNGTSDRMVSSKKAAAVAFTGSENQYLPVFGVQNDGDGFLAVIEEGAARATVKANVAKKYTLYNTVWSSYAFRTYGSVRQVQKDGSEVVANIAEKELDNTRNYKVSYFFLEHGKSDYADMAGCYRSYLEEHSGLQERVSESEDIPLYLELYGYIVKKKSFLGIPVNRDIAMTSIQDANEILDELETMDIDHVVMKYNYWSKDSYYNRIPTGSAVSGRVGSRKEMLALQQRLSDQGGSLYLGADLLNVYKTGHGVSKYSDVLFSAANTAQRIWRRGIMRSLI